MVPGSALGEPRERVLPRADVDGAGAARLDNQYGAAARQRVGRPGDVRLGAAPDLDQDLARPVLAPGGDGEHADAPYDRGVGAHRPSPLRTVRSPRLIIQR